MNWHLVLLVALAVIASVLGLATAEILDIQESGKGTTLDELEEKHHATFAKNPAAIIAMLAAINLGIVYVLNKIGVIGAEVVITLSGKGQEVKIHGAGLLGAFLAVFIVTFLVWRNLNKEI